jgi:Recombination endonuclease VII
MTVAEKGLKKYGLSVGQYDMLLRIQNGVCALCRRPPKRIRLHVDHDHRTEVIRGLLCHRCNRGLGYIQNPDVLRRAVEYVGADTGYRMPKKKRRRVA